MSSVCSVDRSPVSCFCRLRRSGSPLVCLQTMPWRHNQPPSDLAGCKCISHNLQPGTCRPAVASRLQYCKVCPKQLQQVSRASCCGLASRIVAQSMLQQTVQPEEEAIAQVPGRFVRKRFSVLLVACDEECHPDLAWKPGACCERARSACDAWPKTEEPLGNGAPRAAESTGPLMAAGPAGLGL